MENSENDLGAGEWANPGKKVGNREIESKGASGGEIGRGIWITLAIASLKR